MRAGGCVAEARTASHRYTGRDTRRLWLRLLGGFELTVDGSPVLLPASAQRVLAFLAMRDRPVQRLYVAGMLWIDSTEAHANASLRTALWRVQSVSQGAVWASSTHVGLEPAVAVDLGELADAARRAARRGEIDYEQCVDDLLDAGDLLPDWYDDWLIIERERFRQLRMHALEALCEKLAQTGRFSPAIEAGLGAIACEPLRESAHRTLIRAHLLEGNYIEARHQYDVLYGLLATELGIEPGDDLRRMFERELPLGRLAGSQQNNEPSADRVSAWVRNGSELPSRSAKPRWRMPRQTPLGR